ncbi:BTAD domain-containing putative transcriptional regulator [Micromonospora sp. NPDC005220]|uniref:BTAD domain-containing putative transcriptional regulator n=1 Tax=Micromonospora sp. NPDC005220 TaxID=3155589 RepID=UPI0033B20435
MEIKVLGAIHAVIDSHKVNLGSRKQRALIALLALRHGAPVPIDEITAALWENQSPSAPQSLVHTYIARLRQVMEPHTPARQRTNVIGHSGTGYQLRLPLDAVDVSRFHSYADHGLQLLASGAPGKAYGLLRRALGEWPIALTTGLESLLPACEDVTLLRGKWTTVAMAYVRAGLTSQDAVAVLPTAERLAWVDPLNEAAQALYLETQRRTGHGASALSHYDRIRIRLQAELGVDPGHELRRVHRQLVADSGSRNPGPAAGGWLGPGPAVDPLVDRENELRQLRDLLVQQRLVTLSGPAGVGKSAVARVAAADARPHFRDGVAVVDLATACDAADAADALRRTLHPMLPSRHTAPVRPFDDLAERQILLLLDNAENVLEPCVGLVDDLLRGCPQVRVLVTSRELLGLPYETILTIGPLRPPGAGTSADPTALLRVPAVKLFARRAAQACPSFSVHSGNSDLVAAICRRLDGLPLALELAARVLRTTDLPDLAEQCRDPLRLLDATRRGTPAHHRSLHAAVVRTVDRLTLAEQQCLALVSGMEEPVSPGMVETTARSYCDPDARFDLRPLLNRLVDKSLLMARHDEHGTSYRMLRAIRRIGLQLLDRFGTTPSVANALCQETNL